ncbi:amino acid ABC transporter substrate-binding protein [Roseomonas sp. SSH11]|uniref:Amino acid ABC transporter substrate-binding protein n=1 Tax=Pararoseomonas baculiformis TaxID=2820812 RepID=A0ABS4A9H6_9PROT|nr:amino acid ABC transporter substrate-binding protein [Pararoseomonas baculiformis]MBP0443657.1 amino acid ABC transporter substrate-binding protein [Pararoseomonas baculiformis]
MNSTITRRGALGAAAAALAAPAVRAQGAPSAVRIGYAISKTGPNAGGAAITTIPNYEMWVKEVNAAGGLRLGQARVPIQVTEYDDRSVSEDTVRAAERLVNQDRVDFVLPPWGTALNLAVAPILNRAGYPHLASTAVTDRAPELGRRWTNSFWMLGTGSGAGAGLVEVLAPLKQQGRIGDTVALVSVADGFGIELANGMRPAFQRAGFRLTYDRSYPVGTQDMAPILAEAARGNPEVFVACSYPPDTLAITEQARVSGFNPKVFYTGVGTAFPLYKQRFGAATEGVMGVGGVDASSQRFQDYLRRHVASAGREPDRWASAITFASLEMLQQAIERVGRIDRAAVIRELQTGSFDTVIGPVKLQNNLLTDLWQVGQWQGGEFYGLMPLNKQGAKPAILPKPAWPAA